MCISRRPSWSRARYPYCSTIVTIFSWIPTPCVLSATTKPPPHPIAPFSFLSFHLLYSMVHFLVSSYFPSWFNIQCASLYLLSVVPMGFISLARQPRKYNRVAHMHVAQSSSSPERLRQSNIHREVYELAFYYILFSIIFILHIYFYKKCVYKTTKL